MEKNLGKVTQVIGAVVDVRFDPDALPKIRDLLYVEDGDARTPLEVEKHLGEGVVRCIALKATEGLARGMAVLNTGAPITVDDNALCILRMSGGAVGTLAASWTVYGHECQSTCLYGTKGIMLIYNEASAPITVSDLEGNTTSYNLDVPHNGTGVIDEFVDALVHDREPEVSGREALTVMRTIFASINSSNISRTVAVNSDFVTHF